jgi:TolB-like protein
LEIEPGLGGDPAVGDSQRAVFLSYASEDADAAQRICVALRAAGIEVWFDRSDLRGGDAWDSAIRRQIKSCGLFIPIISSHTRARVEGYFRLEWKLAVDRSYLIAPERAFLLPIVIDDTHESDALVPDKFREVQWTRLPGGETPPAFVERVSRLLSRDSNAPRGLGGALREQVTPTAAIAQAAASRRSRLALLLLLTAIVLAMACYAISRLVLPRDSDSMHAAVPSTPSVMSAPTAITEKSIAVLPFLDMSEKHDQEYFSDGLAEELLDMLAKVPGLQVIARTSSFSFKGKSEDIPTIAKKLSVANILEGSVRKSGSHLRITTQLVRADTGVHIWSETYDRDQEDVFKVQEDIARTVVDKLKVALLGDVPVSSARTSNAEVYNLFLQGRYFVAFDTADGLLKSIDCDRRAIALDAGYAPAWAALSNAIFRQTVNGYVRVDAGYKEAMAAARKAAELDPTLADAYNMIGSIKMAAEFDWSGARDAFNRALRLDPGNADALLSAALLTRSTGTTEETLAQSREALARDPLNLLRRRYLGRVLLFAGRYDEAEAMLRQVLDMSPSFPAAHYELGRIYLLRDQPSKATAEFEAEQSAAWRPFGLPLGYHAQGRSAEASAALAAQIKHSAGNEFQLVETYGYFGDADKAFYWLDQAVRNHDPGVLWLRGNPFLKPLTADPRYAARLQLLKLPP